MKSMNDCRIRAASMDDSAAMAKLIDIAGDGIPNLLWSKIAETGQSPLDVGKERACREIGGFSYRNALIAEIKGSVIGMMLGYIVEPPSDDDVAGLSCLPEMVRPFVMLEHKSVGTFYINALAVFPGWHGCGIGSRLLKAAEQTGRERGVTDMSIQNFAQNRDAARLYARFGYRCCATSPVLSHPCHPYYTGDVELRLKSL